MKLKTLVSVTSPDIKLLIKAVQLLWGELIINNMSQKMN